MRKIKKIILEAVNTAVLSVLLVVGFVSVMVVPGLFVGLAAYLTYKTNS